MKIQDVMTSHPRTCWVDDSADEAARIMWEEDCGALPVIDRENRLMAMVTDRDICMAAYIQGRPLVEIVVSSAASRHVVSVRPTDDVEIAERLMERHQVRRIPVVDEARHVLGIVTMNDLTRRAASGAAAIRSADVMRTLAAISQPHAHAPHGSGNS